MYAHLYTVITIIIVLSFHPDTFSCIAITSDSNNLSELIQEVKQVYFETGTGQSLKRRPVWKNRGRLRIRTHRGAAPCHRIPTRRGKRPRVMQQKRPPMSGQPLESSVTCLQSQTHIVIYPCRATCLTGRFRRCTGVFCSIPSPRLRAGHPHRLKSEYLYVIFMFTFI